MVEIVTLFQTKTAKKPYPLARHIPVQWNPANTDTKGTCHSVRIKRALRENVRNTCFIDIKTKADSFTNQGLVEVCEKAVNRGGSLGMRRPAMCLHF